MDEKTGKKTTYREGLEKELEKVKIQESYLEKAIALTERFTELSEHRHLGVGNRELMTREVNGLVTDVEFRSYSYSDETYASPYVMIDGIKIHSDPRQIEIGADYPDGVGIVPDPHWKERLKNAGMPDSIQPIIEKYLQERSPEDLEGY